MPLCMSRITPAAVVGMYQIACMMIEKASASAYTMAGGPGTFDTGYGCGPGNAAAIRDEIVDRSTRHRRRR